MCTRLCFEISVCVDSCDWWWCVCADVVWCVCVNSGTWWCVSRSQYKHRLRQRTAFQPAKLAVIFSTTKNCNMSCLCLCKVCVCVQDVCVVRIQTVKAHGLSVLIRLLDSLFQNERPKTESAPPLYTRPHTPNIQSTRNPRTHQSPIPSSPPLSTPSTNFTHADTRQTKHTDSKHQIHTHAPNTSVHIRNSVMCPQSCETLHITICSEITCKSFFNLP